MVRHHFVSETPTFFRTEEKVNTTLMVFDSLPKVGKEANLLLTLPMVCYIGLIYNLTPITILRSETV